MTEYDYSPDAVEKYYAKLNSVARWVDRQAYEANKYGNPFLPSEDGGDDAGTAYVHQPKNLSRSISTPVDPRVSDSRHSRSRSHAHRHHHREPHQGHSSNASTPTLVQAYGSTAPRYSAGNSSHPQSQSQSQSRTTTRAHARPPPARSQTFMYASQPKFSASHGQLAGTSYPARSATLPAQVPMQYAPAPGQPVVRGHQTYVVVPPHGARVEVRSPQKISPTYQTPATIVYSQPVSHPNNSKKKPLLKRLFSGSSTARRADVPMMSGDTRRRTSSMHY